MIKIWIDDIRTPPSAEWVWVKSVNDAITEIIYDELNVEYEGEICLISLDHDAGDYASDGGDYIKLLDWLEETGRNYPIHIHTDNAVARERMRAIIQRNGWTEVK
jgi:hypothetical protein